MDEGNKDKYRRLINNLWYIYGNYSGAINYTNDIKREIVNGISVDDTPYEEGTIDKAVGDLNTSRSNIYTLIMNIRYKG